MTPLCEIALKTGTDKVHLGYTPLYHEWLKDEPVRRMLEIGVWRGYSLRMWRDFFPMAQVYGLDLSPRFMVHGEPRIKTAVCDQGNEASLALAAANFGGGFDLIVDDGSHEPTHQVASCRALLPFLRPGGMYVIEDVLNVLPVASALPVEFEVFGFEHHPYSVLRRVK